MKRLEKAFDSIKTPESWKENLYKAAYAEEKITVKKRMRMPIKRAIAVSIAAATICLASALTVGAITGTFNIADILRIGFSDEVSADKYIRGQYQPLNVKCENKNVSFEALAFMGDIDETYTLLVARPKTDMVFDNMAIEVSVLENTVTDLEAYATFTVNGIPDIDESGNTVYFFNVRNLPSCGLYEEYCDSLVVRVHKIIYYNNGCPIYDEPNLKMEFIPDRTKLSPIEFVDHMEEVSINGNECIVQSTHISDYQASISILYEFPEKIDENFYDYSIGDGYVRDIFGLKSENAYLPVAEEFPVKLVVDGKIIEFCELDEEILHYPIEHAVNIWEGEGVASLSIGLNYEPFTFSEAESVALEIETTNGETKIIKIK